MPGMTLVEPSCEQEVELLLDWCVNQAAGSSYLRLVSLPCDIPYKLPQGYKTLLGQGVTLLEGSDVTVIAAGPVLLSSAIRAAQILAKEKTTSVKVINLPWLNQIDVEWLKGEIINFKHIFVLDNHYRIGGQGDMIARAISEFEYPDMKVTLVGVNDIPPSGTNLEVLARVGLDTESLKILFASGDAAK